MTRPHPAVLVAVGLPLLLAVAVAALGISARVSGSDAAATPDTRPLVVVPLDAPAAAGPECTALLAALPAELPSTPGPLPARRLAEPAPTGVRAWAATPRPAVLRCGLTRPAELTPTSVLLEVDGVSWLELVDAGAPEPTMVTLVVVDRPVYLVLTVPTGAGSAPLQVVSQAVRATLPQTAVAVR